MWSYSFKFLQGCDSDLFRDYDSDVGFVCVCMVQIENPRMRAISLAMGVESSQVHVGLKSWTGGTFIPNNPFTYGER